MARPKNRKDGSPLDAKMRALHEQQEKLRRMMEEKQKLIDDAPRIAKPQENNRRKEVMSRDSRVFKTLKATTLADPRAGLHSGSRSKPARRRTRREKQEARIRFFVLLVVVACLVGWLIHALS
jgi:hypothetical protein